MDVRLNISDSPVRRLVALACVLALGTGCRYHDVNAFTSAPGAVVNQTPYTVAPPDVLTILSPQVAEINQATVTIHPDGKIYLPLLGPVFVAGLTQDEIAAVIEGKARQYYKDVRVIIQISGYKSKHIYVWGQVSNQGPYAYTGADTVMDILSRARPNNLADTSRVQVYRQGPGGKVVHRMTINLEKWIETGMLDRNVVLAEDDILYIPPTGLARAGLAMQQLLLPIQPAANIVSGPGEIDEDLNKGPYVRP